MDVFASAYPDACSSIGAASRAGNSQVLHELLMKGLDYTIKDNRGWYPMHEAAFGGHIECVKILLETAMSDCESTREILDCVFPPAFDGETPLSIASSEGHVEVVKHLMSLYKESELGIDKMGYPLHESCKNGHNKCIEILVDEFPMHVNMKDSRSGDYPIHVIVEKENIQATKFLIQNGADVNVQDSDDLKTPLHVAVSIENEEIVKLLINEVKDVNATDITDCTPLYLAAQNGNENIVRLLLNKGADPLKCMYIDHMGLKSFPLTVAAEKGHFPVVKLLAKITPKDCCISAVILSAFNRHNDCLLYLFRKGYSTFHSDIKIAGESVWDILLGHNNGFESFSSTVKILIENDTLFSDLARREEHLYFKYFILPMRFNDVNIVVLNEFLNAGLLELRFNCETFPNLSYSISGHKVLQDRLILNSRYPHYLRNLSKISLCLRYFPFLSISHNSSLPLVVANVDDLLHGILVQNVPSLVDLTRWVIRCYIIKVKGLICSKHITCLNLPRKLEDFLLQC
ncbi:uncharacterized protein LOC120331723 [Styela clava]